MRIDFRRAVLIGGIVLLNVLLFVPALIWVDGWRALFRISFEWGLALIALAALAPTRLRAPARWLAVLLYSFLVLFLFYQHAFKAVFVREPALVEDWRFAINLVHFLSEMRSAGWLILIWGSVIGSLVLIVVIERLLAALQREAWPRRTLLVTAAAFVVLGGVSIVLGGPIRLAGARLADNYRASVAVRRRLGALRRAAPDLRYQRLMDVRLARRPSFYLLTIEAYGEILATWDMKPAYQALMARVGERLERAGFHMRTAYSAAAVHGGRSWLSIATLQSGIVIDEPDSFAAFESVSRRIPTLIQFFRNQGYHTASLEPGTKPRPGLNDYDLYGHDRRITAPEIRYGGRPFGFGEIPDQYSLEVFQKEYLPPEPRYLWFMAVTTHYAWGDDSLPPFVRNVATLDAPSPPASDDADWPPLAGVDAIDSHLRRNYFKTVEYEWRALIDFLAADPSKDLVVVVLGDHQPRLESNQPGEVTFDSPVHIIARDPSFVDRFADVGFQPGMYAEPGRALQHEGLFTLLVKKLADAYGTAETRDLARYFPDGISLAGLNQ
jgi:hypothetical protein